MRWKAGQDFIDRLRFSMMNEQKYRAFKKRIRAALSNESYSPLDPFDISTTHSQYGKIYYPIYNLSVHHNEGGGALNVYNEFGEKLEVFFIRDIHSAHAGTRRSKRILWDRYDFGLKTHFYTHNCMLQTMGKPDKRYGMLVESESIVPNDYKIFDENKGLEKDFDLIFTYSAKILDSISNARFVPFCANIWNEDLISPDLYTKKTKHISILSSDKLMCELHKFRFNLACQCKKEKLADTFGTFDGGVRLDSIAPTLNDYRFTICLENDISPYYFSERLTSALAAQTIPIYLGATEIDKFFNPDGIIKITTKSDIKEVLKQCTKEEYERRLPAVLDNYERALEYTSKNDFIYEYVVNNKECFTL